MPKHGKNYNQSSSKIESAKRYEFSEAIDAAISSAYAKFDETIDVAVRLGVDPRHVALPRPETVGAGEDAPVPPLEADRGDRLPRRKQQANAPEGIGRGAGLSGVHRAGKPQRGPAGVVVGVL